MFDFAFFNSAFTDLNLAFFSFFDKFLNSATAAFTAAGSGSVVADTGVDEGSETANPVVPCSNKADASEKMSTFFFILVDFVLKDKCL